jgi:hypothetical protein
MATGPLVLSGNSLPMLAGRVRHQPGRSDGLRPNVGQSAQSLSSGGGSPEDRTTVRASARLGRSEPDCADHHRLVRNAAEAIPKDRAGVVSIRTSLEEITAEGNVIDELSHTLSAQPSMSASRCRTTASALTSLRSPNFSIHSLQQSLRAGGSGCPPQPESCDRTTLQSRSRALQAKAPSFVSTSLCRL